MIKSFLLLLASVLALLAGPAQAQTVTPQKYWYSNYISSTNPQFDTDIVALCKRGVQYLNDNYRVGMVQYVYLDYVPQGTGSSDMWCRTTTPPSTSPDSRVGVYARSCTTATPYFDMAKKTCVATDPVPDPCSDKNPMIRRYNYKAPPYTSPDNFNGCKITPMEMLTCGKDSSGVQYCFWKVVRTGEKYTGPDTSNTGGGSSDPSTTPPTGATPTPSPPIAPPPPPPGMCSTCRSCPAGTVQAGISADGIPMCVGTGTNPPPPPVPPPSTTKPPTTTTGADGSTVVKQDTVQSNSDGSTTTTTTTTTTAPDGTKTVTVAANTSAAASGSPGRTDSNPQDDKYNLCKQNPTLSICRESSVNGTCGQITCTGDAIQCATLRAAALMQCQQQKDIDDLTASPQKDLGASILSGADPMKTDIDNMLKGSETDLSKPSLDQAGFLGGGSCLANRSFTVLGKPVQVNFTELCSNIQPLRAVIMAVAFLAAYMLVSRSVLQS